MARSFLAGFKRSTPSVTVNLLIKKVEGLFVAHCLEMDIVTTGKTIEEVQKDIIDLICAQVDYAFAHENLDHLYHPAPVEVWQEFFACEEQEERKHRIESGFNETVSPPPFIPPWIITRTCLAQGLCRA